MPSRRRRGPSRSSDPASPSEVPVVQVQPRGNAASTKDTAEPDRSSSMLDAIGDWFGRRADDLSSLGNAASVAWDARTLLNEENGQRKATVNAGEASKALQDHGSRIGLNEQGRDMLAGVSFADEDQALDLLVDHNTGTASIGAEDLKLAGVEQGNFRVGATHLTGMSAGGNFLSDGDRVEVFARAETVDARDLHVETPGGAVKAGGLALKGFLTEASYDKGAKALDTGSATKGRFEVASATVSDVDLMGMTTSAFSADGLSGDIDVDAGTAGMQASGLSASDVESDVLGGVTVGKAGLSGLSMSSDFSDPEAIRGEVHAEAAELARVLTPYGEVTEVTGSGLKVAHDAGTGATTGGLDEATAQGMSEADTSIRRADLKGASFTQDADGLTADATRVGLLGVRSGEFSSAGIAVDEGRLHSTDGVTRAEAGHVRADHSKLGDQATVDLAQLSGFHMSASDKGVDGGMVRGRLRGVAADGGTAGTAKLDEIDAWSGAFSKDETGFRASTGHGSMSGVDLATAGVEASVSRVDLQDGRVSTADGRADIGLGQATMSDARFTVDPSKATGGGDSDFDLARTVETGSRLVDDVDASVGADLIPGRYGPARVREGTRVDSTLYVRDGAVVPGTRVDFSRDLQTPFATDVGGAKVGRNGKLELDVGVPVLGPLFGLEVGVNATDQVNEAMGRSGKGIPSVAELGTWAADQLRGDGSSASGASPLDLRSMRASANMRLGEGTVDAGMGQVDVKAGNLVSVQTVGLEQVVTQFSRFLANSLTVDLGDASASAGPGAVEDARIAVGEAGTGIMTGTVGKVDVKDVKVRS